MAAGGTIGGDGGVVAAGVAEELELVSVEGEGEEAAGTESLPAAVVADGEGGGAAAVVEDDGLGVICERFGDGY